MTMVFPTHVREQILQQHPELRTLWCRVTDHLTRSGVDEEEQDAARLRVTVLELCERFQPHLIFERCWIGIERGSPPDGSGVQARVERRLRAARWPMLRRRGTPRLVDSNLTGPAPGGKSSRRNAGEP